MNNQYKDLIADTGVTFFNMVNTEMLDMDLKVENKAAFVEARLEEFIIDLKHFVRFE